MLTLRRERKDVVISDPSDSNIYVVGEETLSKEMTLCRTRSLGVLGTPFAAK